MLKNKNIKIIIIIFITLLLTLLLNNILIKIRIKVMYGLNTYLCKIEEKKDEHSLNGDGL